jgi:hypothetical protein
MIKLKKSKEAILKKAGELAIEYEKRYKGCAQCTFLAVVDSLRWGGIELLPVSMEEKLYPAVSMLTAGVCMSGEGTCGAVASSVMSLGLALGIPKDSSDVTASRQAASTVRNIILEGYFNKYHSILCKDIQRKYFGKAWDLTDNKMAHEFLGITKGCIISEAVNLAVKCILDEIEKGA